MESHRVICIWVHNSVCFVPETMAVTGSGFHRNRPPTTKTSKTRQKQRSITGDNTSAENHCTIFTIAQDPRNEQIIWAGTDDGNLQVTRNGGKTWENKAAAIWKTGVPEHAWISSIWIPLLNPQRIVGNPRSPHVWRQQYLCSGEQRRRQYLEKVQFSWVYGVCTYYPRRHRMKNYCFSEQKWDCLFRWMAAPQWMRSTRICPGTIWCVILKFIR